LETLLENVVLLDLEVSKRRFRAVDKFAFGECVNYLYINTVCWHYWEGSKLNWNHVS